MLNFGEVVPPVDDGATGWAQLELDGSYALSSFSLSPVPSLGLTPGVGMGQLRIRVENAASGSAVGIQLSALSQRFTLVPSAVQSFQLNTGATSGEFYLDFGGQLFVENGMHGSVAGDINVNTTCTSTGD